MAFPGPAPLAPDLTSLDGRTQGQVTVEMGLLGIQLLAAMGVQLKPGLDKPLLTIGRFAVTVPAGGMLIIPFTTPFPKECSVAFAQCDLVPLKWYQPNRTQCVFQRGDGAAGPIVGNFLAIGC